MPSHIHIGTQSKVENKTFFKKKVISKQRERTVQHSYLQAARENSSTQLPPSSKREQFETATKRVHN